MSMNGDKIEAVETPSSSNEQGRLTCFTTKEKAGRFHHDSVVFRQKAHAESIPAVL